MRIHSFWDASACGMIRICMPLDAMRDLGGHTITTSCGWNAERSPGLIKDADIVIGQRFDKTEALQIWRRLRPQHKLVYEIDDDLWNIDPLNVQAKRLRELSAQDAVESCLEVSHLVTVTTPTLARTISKYNSNIAVLPNCVEGRMLKMERPRRDKLVVGWAGGSSHIRDLASIRKPLQRFFNQTKQAEFHNIGDDFRTLLGLKNHRHTPWHPNLFTYYGYIDFDIALAPLANTTFNYGKSGIKALEAMALGVPVIASDLPPYQDVVEHGKTGFLVGREHEWMKYLRLLANDRNLREKMGQAGRERARRWTIENNWKAWEAAYQQLLSPTGK